MSHILLIFGGKSTALEIREVINSFFATSYKKVLLVIPDNEIVNEKLDYILNKDLLAFVRENNCKYIVGFSNQEGRERVQKEMLILNVDPVNVIHPNAIISESVELGLGNYIAAGSIVSYNAKILDHCIINYHVSIGHDALIKTNSVILPGSRISGNVIVGERVLIGANSFIFQGKSIGNDCIIDAMTYVKDDLEDFHICSSRTFKKFKRVK